MKGKLPQGKEASAKGASQVAGREALEIVTEISELLVRYSAFSFAGSMHAKGKGRIPALIAHHLHTVYT